MKVDGIELKDAGCARSESMPIAKEENSEKVDGKREKTYTTIYSNNKEMPLNLKGIKSGDKLMLVCLVNVKEHTTIDTKGKKDEQAERFTLEILKCGAEKASEKDPDAMEIDEINEVLAQKKQVEGKG
jgi:hypothetical protein